MTVTINPAPTRLRAELVVLDDRFAKVAGDEYLELSVRRQPHRARLASGRPPPEQPERRCRAQ